MATNRSRFIFFLWMQVTLLVIVSYKLIRGRELAHAMQPPIVSQGSKQDIVEADPVQVEPSSTDTSLLTSDIRTSCGSKISVEEQNLVKDIRQVLAENAIKDPILVLTT